MTDPIVGTAEDFTIEVLTELQTKIRHSALEHITVNDEHLLQDATELPQLIFYYQAAFCRLNLRAATTKIRLDETEANVYVQLRAQAVKAAEKMTTDEIKARITIDPTVMALGREHLELEAKAAAIKGILEALRQKGYSLQLVASIRSKEEDWLRSSFASRFANNPNRDRIVSSFNQLVGDKVL
jgi:hypothetical protein